MSWADFASRAVDLDLLADYSAGVLDPPRMAEVAHLISTEPTWARAHAALARADAAVRVDLRAYGQSRPEPMPADVVARVDDALRAAAGPTNVVPISAARGRARHASGPRRKFATGLAAAAAAAVALIGGLAVVQNLDGARCRTAGLGARTSASDSGRGDDAGGVGRRRTSRSAGHIGIRRGPGRDQHRDQLRPGHSGPVFPRGFAGGAAGSPHRSVRSASDPLLSRGTVRDTSAFERLNSGSSLRACLAAVTAQHPGQALVVDYASFEGQPALVVLVVGADRGCEWAARCSRNRRRRGARLRHLRCGR